MFTAPTRVYRTPPEPLQPDREDTRNACAVMAAPRAASVGDSFDVAQNCRVQDFGVLCFGLEVWDPGFRAFRGFGVLSLGSRVTAARLQGLRFNSVVCWRKL